MHLCLRKWLTTLYNEDTVCVRVRACMFEYCYCFFLVFLFLNINAVARDAKNGITKIP